MFNRLGNFHVYMLRCADGTLYAGYTSDLDARLKLHAAGKGAKYVRGKGPLELVYAKAYRYYRCAVLAELKLKRLPKERKEALAAAFLRKRDKTLGAAMGMARRNSHGERIQCV